MMRSCHAWHRIVVPVVLLPLASLPFGAPGVRPPGAMSPAAALVFRQVTVVDVTTGSAGPARRC